MDIEAYKKAYQDEDAAPGWDAIDSALGKLYPNREPDQHFGTTIKYMLGGPDPLDGISVYKANYKGEEYYHLITYGFSSLYYDEESVGADYSKYGFELTMRLKPYSEDEGYPMWALSMLQNIARYVFETGKWFEQFHYMPANGPIRQDTDTLLVGLAFDNDPELDAIDTPHGRVEFMQVFGITELELKQSADIDRNSEKVLAKHRKLNPLLISDLERNEI